MKRRARHLTHGMSRTREYQTWSGMKSRCLNKKVPKYKLYGGRGVKVCQRWMKFENFYKDMGSKPVNKSLDRIDNEKGYNKKNCRWATQKKQQNNRRDNIFVSVNGVQISFKELAKMFSINEGTLYCRIFKHNWKLKEALTASTNAKQFCHNGETKTLQEWGTKLGVNWKLLYRRIYRNKWSIKRAFTKSVRKTKVQANFIK